MRMRALCGNERVVWETLGCNGSVGWQWGVEVASDRRIIKKPVRRDCGSHIKNEHAFCGKNAKILDFKR